MIQNLLKICGMLGVFFGEMLTLYYSNMKIGFCNMNHTGNLLQQVLRFIYDGDSHGGGGV